MSNRSTVVIIFAYIIALLMSCAFIASCYYTASYGKSAYEIAVDNGYSGSENEWIQSLAGQDGESGKSAYELAVEKGYTGSEDEWLSSLVGKPGTDGVNGKSAYELAVENGYNGTLTDWLNSLIGKSGEKGDRGEPGVGIDEIHINENGELIITLSDNSVYNLGVIAGKNGQNGSDGTDGTDGNDGVGVSDILFNDYGELVISMSDGTSYNLGDISGADGQNGKDGEDGVNGQNGEDGKDGVGISNITLSESGELIITLSDNTVYNLGTITGADGQDGADGQNGKDGEGGVNGQKGGDGKDGVGISNITLSESGELIITLSDNTVYNLGTITGADGQDGADGNNGKDGKDGVNGQDGRGIEKVDIVNEDLIIYYTDGDIQNVGTVVGASGADDEYTIAFVADGKVVSVENYTSADGNITVPEVPEKEGYSGEWENYTLAVGDMIVNAIYTPGVYDLDISMIGRYGKISGSGKYHFGDNVTISAEAFPGYEFIGWYENDQLISDEMNYSFTMPANNILYTAKFTLQKELVPFEFTISESGCIITGVTNPMMTELVIPDCVIKVNDGALSDCKNLTSLTLPFGDKPVWSYFSKTSVSIPTTLKELTYSEGVTTICASALEGCSALTDVYLPSTIVEIGSNVFDSCAGMRVHISSLETFCSINSESIIYPVLELIYNGEVLTEIIVPDGVARIGVGVFSSYVAVTKVVIPESVMLIGANAFKGDNYLSDIEIEYGVIMIGDFAFSSCGSIENLILPDSVTALGNSAFSGSGLQSIVLSDGMNAVAWGTFNYCADLKQIVIPDSITYISENAFNYCNSLSKVYYEGTQTDWNNIIIDENNGGLINATKYFYSESKPLDAGNYWYYAEDGITPVEW